MTRMLSLRFFLNLPAVICIIVEETTKLTFYVEAAAEEIQGDLNACQNLEFYENLNEIVYASDMDTHEIIYMNLKACEVYGIKDLEEVRGKKNVMMCYIRIPEGPVSSAPTVF